MANGLRKLIKRARKQLNHPANLARNRFGPRLNVEELEERIAPAALPAGEYMIYDSDTAGEANVLLNYGTASVDVVVTDGVGDGNLDTLVIDCNVAGSVKLWSSGELSGTGGVLITDSAAVDLTLTTGVITVGGASLLDWDTVTGGAQVPVNWTAGSVAHVTNTAYRAGVTDVAIAAPATANLLAALDGNITGSITLDNTSSAITGLTTTAVGDNGDLAGAITTAADANAIVVAGTATGTLWDIGDEATGVWTAGTFSVTAVTTAADWDASLTTSSTTPLTGTFTIGGILNGLISTTAAGADIAANFTVNGATAGLAVSAAGGLETTVGATSDITGSFNAPNGNIAGAGTSGGDFMESLGSITSTTISAKNISGNITAATSINSAISATDTAALAAPAGLGITGTIASGTTLAGSVTSAAPQGDITAVTAGGGAMSATVTSANTIGTVSATSGNVSGPVTAAGTITLITTVTSGDLTGAVNMNGTTAGDTVTAVTLAGALSANVTSQRDIGAVTLGAGSNFAAGVTVQASNDITGAITVPGDFLGTVTTLNGDLGPGTGGISLNVGDDYSGTVNVGQDLTGRIQTTTALKPIAGPINVTRNILDDIVSADAITGAITAVNIGGAGAPVIDIWAQIGNITSIIIGGNINDVANDVRIAAEDTLTYLKASGYIGGQGNTVTIHANEGTLFATDDVAGSPVGDVVSVIAGGAITADIEGVNIDLVKSGGAAADNIAGNIDASADIDLINAGNGLVTAATNSTITTSASPLATYIHNGFSFAVWAFSPGTTTPLTTVTAMLAWTAPADISTPADGINDPSLAITQLDSNGAAVDIVIASRVATTAEQVYTDNDVNVVVAPMVVTAVAATASSDVGTVGLTVEGNLNLAGLTNLGSVSPVVEGGIQGTLPDPAGGDLTYGSISGNLTIPGNVGTLTLYQGINAAAAVTINGTVTRIVLGASGLGTTGNIGAGASIIATGAIGEVIIQGNVDGTIQTTDFTGAIQISGNVGDAANVAITATAGDIPSLLVSGNIGDTGGARTVAISATEGNIGTVQAGGWIGDATGGADVITVVASTTTAGIDGSIGTVTAGGASGGIGMENTTVTADGNVTTVSTTSLAASLEATVTSNTGNVGTVSTNEGALNAAASVIRANAGNIDQVVVLDDASTVAIRGAGSNNAVIITGGDVDLVASGTGLIGGTTTARLGASGSAVTTWITVVGVQEISRSLWAYEGGDPYVDTTAVDPAEAIFDYVYTGGTTSVDITVDNWDGAAAYDTTLNVALMSTTLDLDGTTVIQSANQFNLEGLDFDPASVAGGANDLGTLIVEGGIFGAGFPGLDVGSGGTITNLFVEADVAQQVLTTSVAAVSVGMALGVDEPTAAQIEVLFANPDGGAVTFADPGDVTVMHIPVSPASGAATNANASFTFGNGANLLTPSLLGSGDAAVGTGVQLYTLTLVGDAVTTVTGELFGAGGDYTHTGDLDYTISGWQLRDVVVTGSILATGGINANAIRNITVGLANDATVDAGTGLIRGTMAGTITSTNDPNNAAVNGTIGDVVIYGDLTGTIQCDGNLGNTLLGGLMPNLTGGIQIGQSILSVFDGSVLSQVGTMTGDARIIVGGDVTGGATPGINSVQQLGGTGLIMVGTRLSNVISDQGAVTADIYSGGLAGGGDNVFVSGVGITGNMTFGGANGIDTLQLDVLSSPTSAPTTYLLTNTANAGMAVEIGENDLSLTHASIDQVTMIEDSAAFVATSGGAGTIDVDQILVLENTAAALAVTIEGNLGNLLAAEGSTIARTSDALQDAIQLPYATTFDVVAEPTALDAELADDAAIALTLTLRADNVTGGIVADSNLALDVATPGTTGLGYLVSLNGSVTTFGNDVHSAVAIGSIVASEDVDGQFISEGTLALADPLGADSLNTILTNAYGATIASYVPTWFAGGILVEVGDVSAASEFHASGPDAVQVVQGLPMGGGDAMGTVYIMAGSDLGAEYDIHGNMGGLWIPVGTANPDLNVTGSITNLVAPNMGVATPIANVTGIQATNGEVVAAAVNPYSYANMSVTPGAGVLAIIQINDPAGNVPADTTNMWNVTVLGLAGGTTLDIDGDVTTLNVVGNWGGAVDVDGVALDGTDGTIGGYRIDLNMMVPETTMGIVVDGNIESTATLDAFNFSEVIVGGTIDPAVGGTQSISGGDSLALTKLQGGDMTLYMLGSPTVDADVTSLFNKVTSVDITGNGIVRLLSMDGDVTGDLRSMILATVLPASFLTDAGNAHIGDVSVAGGVTLASVAVDGALDALETNNSVSGLYVNGDAGDITVGNILSRAFIDGDVTHSLRSGIMVDVDVMGDANEIAGSIFVDVHASGITNQLRIGGRGGIGDLGTTPIKGWLINSTFDRVMAAPDASNVMLLGNSYIG